MLKLPRNPRQAFNLLKKDHDAVKKLFSRFGRAETIPEKKEIVREALPETEKVPG